MKGFSKIFILFFISLTYLFSGLNSKNIIDSSVFVPPEKALNSSDNKSYDIGRNLVNAHANSEEDVVTSLNSSKEITFSKKLKKLKEKLQPYDYSEEKALMLLRSWDANNIPKKSNTLAIISQKTIDAENNTSLNASSMYNKKLNRILALKNTFDATCYIPYTLQFSFTPRKIKLHCRRTDNFKKVKVNIVVTPKNESYILLGTPYGYEIDGSLYQANTEISEVTNSLNSDFNIATSVNTQAVQAAIDAATEAIGKSIGKNTDKYLAQAEASRRQQDVYTPDRNNSTILYPVVINKTSTEKPDWKEYAISTAIGGLGDAISSIAANLKSKYPYLYEIKKGTTLYVKVVPKY